MKKRILGAALLAALLMACGRDDRPDPKHPVIVTLWHNYGGAMLEVMDSLIDEFNAGEGRRRGVAVSVTAVTAARELNEQFRLIASGDPGAPKMPDLAVAYPATAQALAAAGLLAPLDGLFSEKELDAFIPRFVEEGRLPDGGFFVFPVAKSTEALYVNRVYFGRFQAATGAEMGDLSCFDTFEGIAAAAGDWRRWSGGKAFYMADSWFNLALTGMAQLGGEFCGPEGLRTGTPEFRRIWDATVLPALKGDFIVSDQYSSESAKGGDIVCATGSTAGILFYGDTVTLPDNTSEQVDYLVLPYPVFQGGRKVALQRGAGMIIAKSEPRREAAAALFIKWFSAPAQNMRFVAGTGYLPVTKEAFGSKMAAEIEAQESVPLRRLMETAMKIYGEYDFVVAPNIEGIDAMTRSFEQKIKAAMREGRRRVLAGEAPEKVSAELFRDFAP